MTESVISSDVPASFDNWFASLQRVA